MRYRFRCNCCLRSFHTELKLSEYDRYKSEPHECPLCGRTSHFERIIEWEGSVGIVGGYDSVAGKASWQE